MTGLREVTAKGLDRGLGYMVGGLEGPFAVWLAWGWLEGLSGKLVIRGTYRPGRLLP